MIGLVALLAVPRAGAGGVAPIHPYLAGIGQVEKALPAELRTARPAVASIDKGPGGTAPLPTAFATADPCEFRSDRAPAPRPVATGPGPVPFLRPVPQAPPASI